MKLDLQKFSGSLTVTVYNDGNFSATSASPASTLAKNDDVALTITPNTGYELDEIEVISGGVEPEYKNSAWGFKMGETDVVLNIKGKKNNLYKIVENTWVWVNGSGTELKRNMTLERGANGAITGVSCTGTAVTVSADVVASLVAQGILIKL